MKIEIHIHHHGGEFDRRLEKLSAEISTLNHKVDKVMATIQQLTDAVTAEKTLVDGLVTLITGLKQQVTDALSGVTLPPAVQAAVDAAFAGVTANSQEMTDALAANTPAAPTV